MKVGTDSDLLGTLSAGGKNILDIGTGTGILSLMLAQRCPEAAITAVEIDDDAVKDASENFKSSQYADRITLVHSSFQDYVRQEKGRVEYDSVVCNPPYFDKSLECKNLGRTRARHTSSLPFRELIRGAYDLLSDGGLFSVCIPKEVLSDFCSECLIIGFSLQDKYEIKTVPDKPAKRFVLVHRKGSHVPTTTHTFCMCNADRTRSEWYKSLMKDFHIA